MTTAAPADLGRILGEEVASVSTRERRFPGAYDSWIAVVELASGTELRLFAKDLGSCPDWKEDRDARREREPYVYRELLAGRGLGTAHYHGLLDDRVLLLEYVDGMPARYCDVPHWIEAARWLGRLHGAFAGEAGELRDSGRLAVHDELYYWRSATRAMASVATYSAELEDRLAATLHRWDAAVDAMVSQPRTLVHGAFRPHEALIVEEAGAVRVCPVDWELAAVGSALHDLATLTDGFEGAELDAFLDAYRDEAARHGFDAPAGEGARFAIECHRLLKHLTLLGHAAKRGYPEGEVASVVAGVERIAAPLLARAAA